MEEKTKSPTVAKKQEVLFDFPTAIKYIKEGGKVSKKEWGDKETYGVLTNGLLVLHKEGKDFSWKISDGDLNGEDWFIL